MTRVTNFKTATVVPLDLPCPAECRTSPNYSICKALGRSVVRHAELRQRAGYAE